MQRLRVSRETLASAVPGLEPARLEGLLPLVDQGATVEHDELGSWLAIDGVPTRVLLVPAPVPATSGPAGEDRGALPSCGTSELRDRLGLVPEAIDDLRRLRWYSKYAHGSVAVEVVFLAGPRVGWTPAGRTRALNAVREAHKQFAGLVRDGGGPAPVVTLHEVGARDSVHPTYDPTTYLFTSESQFHPRYVRNFLRERGLYSGDVNRWDDPADPALQHALFLYLNDLRNAHAKDWAYLLFVMPDDGTGHSTIPDAVPYAIQDYGYCFSIERQRASGVGYDYYVMVDAYCHEAGHMFGAADEYAAACKLDPAGLYSVGNINCGQPAADRCMMKSMYRHDTPNGRGRICGVSGDQMGLILDGASLRPLGDKAVQTYSLSENRFFQNELGVYTEDSFFRKGARVTISSRGWSRLSLGWDAHGPDGDLRTQGDSRFLVPGAPYNAVVGRWMSVDGKRQTPWVPVGGHNALSPPFDAYFVFNINDSRGDFLNNEGSMEVTLTTSLLGHLGKPPAGPFLTEAMVAAPAASTRIASSAAGNEKSKG